VPKKCPRQAERCEPASIAVAITSGKRNFFHKTRWTCPTEALASEIKLKHLTKEVDMVTDTRSPMDRQLAQEEDNNNAVLWTLLAIVILAIVGYVAYASYYNTDRYGTTTTTVVAPNSTTGTTTPNTDTGTNRNTTGNTSQY
jgi:hypothetical protein